MGILGYSFCSQCSGLMGRCLGWGIFICWAGPSMAALNLETHILQSLGEFYSKFLFSYSSPLPTHTYTHPTCIFSLSGTLIKMFHFLNSCHNFTICSLLLCHLSFLTFCFLGDLAHSPFIEFLNFCFHNFNFQEHFLFFQCPFYFINLFMYLCMYVCIYLFLATLGLLCCTRAFFSCVERGLLFIVVCGLLIVVASLVAEERL